LSCLRRSFSLPSYSSDSLAYRFVARFPLQAAHAQARLTTTYAYRSRLPPRVLLPDHLLSFRGFFLAHKASPTFPNRDGAFRFASPIARHPRRSTTRVPWIPHTRQRTFAPAIFPPALGTIGGDCRRASIVFISIPRSIEHSQLSKSERRSFTPHTHHQPYDCHQPLPSRLLLFTVSLRAPPYSPSLLLPICGLLHSTHDTPPNSWAAPPNQF
jgi:hypothetical protein